MLDPWRSEAAAATKTTASRRVLVGTGFQFEGIARALLVIVDVRGDHARYALLRSEWERA